MDRLLLTVLVGVMAVPIAQGDDKDAQAILDKAIKAHGVQKTADVKVHAWKAKGSMVVMGMDLKYDADYYFQMPNKFRFDAEMKFGEVDFKIAAASDGKVAWEQAQGQVREMEKKKKEAFEHNVYSMSLTYLLPLKDKAYKLTALGESKVNDKPALGIRVQREGKADVSLFFEKKSGVLVKMQTTIWDEFSDSKVKQETFISDYTEKNGVKEFGKLTVKRAGKDFIVEKISQQKGLKKAQPKLFVKPKSDD